MMVGVLPHPCLGWHGQAKSARVGPAAPSRPVPVGSSGDLHWQTLLASATPSSR